MSSAERSPVSATSALAAEPRKADEALALVTGCDATRDAALSPEAAAKASLGPERSGPLAAGARSGA